MDDEDRAARVEEEEVEHEAHAEGVDAGAAGDEETRSSKIAIEMGKTEQASPNANRYRDLAPEDLGNGQSHKTGGKRHSVLRAQRTRPSPLAPPFQDIRCDRGANALSGTATQGHRATMIGMIQHLFSPGLWEQMGFN